MPRNVASVVVRSESCRLSAGQSVYHDPAPLRHGRSQGPCRMPCKTAGRNDFRTMPMPLFSIRARFLIVFCLLAVTPVAILGILVFHRTEAILQQRVSREMRVEAVSSAETLETYLEGVQRELLALSRFLQRRLSSEMDDARWREVEEEFYHALQAERSYYQVRFIGTDGWEKLRINNVGGTLMKVDPREYQHKGDRYYVRETLQLAPGEVYLSPLDLNIEHGRLEEPRQLVARMATPVADRGGTVQGIVIINIFGSDLLKLLEQVQPVAGSKLYLVAESGAYIEQSGAGETMEVQTGEAPTLGGRLGIPTAALLSGRSPRVDLDTPSLLATAPVYAGSSTWLLLKTFPRGLLDHDLRQIQIGIWIFALGLLLPTAGLAVVAARSFSRPMAKVVSFANSIAGGDYTQKISLPSRDEFGQLAAALNSMSAALAASRQQLLQWNRSLQEEVQRRTQDLRSSEEKYRLIFSAESDAILTVDTETRRVEEANDAACRLYGYEREELIGMNILHLSGEPEKTLQRTGEVLAGRRQFDLVFHRRKDGSILPVSISAGMFFWQERKMVVGIVRDRTEEQRLETLKDEMLSGISHEMRTPLTAVIGFLELLLENDFPQQQQREYLQIALNEGERLQSLIENLLALQRLRAGETFQRKTVAIRPILERESAAFATIHGENRLRLDCDENLPAVAADPEMLHLALANLLENAVRYSPKQSAIVLGAERRDGGVALRVEDHGPGIPPGVREQIFDRFFRIDFRDGHRIGGTGLGLPLVKEIARLHGGQVRLESREGVGSSFFLILPPAGSAEAVEEVG